MYLDSHLNTYILKALTMSLGIGDKDVDIDVDAFAAAVSLASVVVVLGLINTISIFDASLESVQGPC